MAWTDAQKDAFFKRLSVLAETMGEPLTPVRLVGYCEALEDVPHAAVMIGLKDAAKVCRWFPKPAELRDLALESPEWQRQRERELKAACAKYLPPPPPSREEVQANINRLRGVLRSLAAPKRMR